MAWQELRRMRRRTRQALRIREWPWRRKVAIGAWVPVAVIGFFLFTGPNGSPSGATPEAPVPKTVTTVKAPPPPFNPKDAAERIRSYQQTQTDVSHWVKATPVRLTPQQQFDMLHWLSQRRKQLVKQHKEAQATVHHRAQMKP